MKTYTRDDTVHDVEYVLKAEAEALLRAAIAAESARCAALCRGLREAASHSSTGVKRDAAMAMAESCAKLILAE